MRTMNQIHRVIRRKQIAKIGRLYHKRNRGENRGLILDAIKIVRAIDAGR
jgi:hypothetical protein